MPVTTTADPPRTTAAPATPGPRGPLSAALPAALVAPHGTGLGHSGVRSADPYGEDRRGRRVGSSGPVAGAAPKSPPPQGSC